MTEAKFGFSTVEPETREAWRAWLAEHHERSKGVWLVSAKKASGKPAVSYAESVEEALCFGWIDSLRKKLDDERSMQLFTPRRPKSPRSKLNKERIERLIAAGLMAPAGMARIDEAKRDGSWESYDAIEALTLPADLEAALVADPAADATFRTFSPSARKALLWHVASAKRPETRAKRIAEIVSEAAAGRNLLQWHERQTRPVGER